MTAASAGPRLWASAAVDRRQFLAGLLFGLACTARLTVVFGRRSSYWSAPAATGAGAAGRPASARRCRSWPWCSTTWSPPATSSIPAYDYLYGLEANGYPTLGYHPQWAVEDPRYIPQNLGIALFGLPDLFPSGLPNSLAIDLPPVCTEPGATRGLFDAACPLAVPRDIGMSVILTSPAYLLAIPAFVGTAGAGWSPGRCWPIVAISVVNLMHFSQGWVQFGYRFSNDCRAVRPGPGGDSASSGWPGDGWGIRWRPWPSSSSRSRSTCGAWSGAACSDGDPVDPGAPARPSAAG